MPVKKRKPKAEANLKTIIIKALIGSVAGTALFFALTALTSFICLKNDSSQESYRFFMLAIGAVSGFICGYLAVKPVRKKGFLTGALSVLPMYLITACVSMLASHGGLGVVGWILCGVLLVAGSIGGIIAVS